MVSVIFSSKNAKKFSSQMWELTASLCLKLWKTYDLLFHVTLHNCAGHFHYFVMMFCKPKMNPSIKKIVNRFTDKDFKLWVAALFVTLHYSYIKPMSIRTKEQSRSQPCSWLDKSLIKIKNKTAMERTARGILSYESKWSKRYMWETKVRQLFVEEKSSQPEAEVGELVLYVGHRCGPNSYLTITHFSPQTVCGFRMSQGSQHGFRVQETWRTWEQRFSVQP